MAIGGLQKGIGGFPRVEERVDGRGATPLLKEDGGDDPLVGEIGAGVKTGAFAVFARPRKYAEDRLSLKRKVSGIFDKLKVNLHADSRPYAESLKPVGLTLEGKFYFGRALLYLFGDGGVEVFDIQSMISSFGVLELDDEELGFISESYLGGKRYEPGITRGMLKDANAAKAVLIGMMSSLHSSAVNDLTEFFGNTPISDRIMEKTFIEGSLPLAG